MKKFAFLLVVSVFAVPAFAQSTEFGVLFGGSKRITGNDEPRTGGSLMEDSFKFSNSTLDLYYAVNVDEGTLFKINVGRINTPVGFRDREVRDGETVDVRVDAEGMARS